MAEISNTLVSKVMLSTSMTFFSMRVTSPGKIAAHDYSTDIHDMPMRCRRCQSLFISPEYLSSEYPPGESTHPERRAARRRRLDSGWWRAARVRGRRPCAAPCAAAAHRAAPRRSAGGRPARPPGSEAAAPPGADPTLRSAAPAHSVYLILWRLS